MRREWDDHHIEHLQHEIDRTTREIRDLEHEGHRWRHRMRHQQHELRHATRKTVDELHRLEKHGSGHGGGGWSFGAGGGDRAQETQLYTAVAAGAGVLAVLAGVVLAAGHLSALLFSGGWPRYRSADIPTLLMAAVRNPGDPAAGWEKVSAPGGTIPPGPELLWPTFLVLLAAVAVPVWFAYKAGWFGGKDRAGAMWAKPAQVRHLHVRRAGDTVVVGTMQRRKIGTRDSLLVTGPAHAGKTSAVAVPAVLNWMGPAIVATTDPRLVSQTIGWRSRLGDVHVFDPAAATSFHRSGWNPLHDCGRWPDAVRTAQLINAAVGTAAGDVSGLSLSSMALSLAPFLHAAAVDGRSVVQVAEWLARDERLEVLEILQPQDPAAAAVHQASQGRDDDIRKRFLRLMFDVFSVYLDPVVAKSAARHDVVVDELLDGGANTLYLTAPGADHMRFTPLFAAIVRQALARADQRVAASGAALDPRLLVVFDEGVGVVADDDLAGLVASNSSARGIQILSLLESAPPRVIQSHRARLMLRGDAPDPSAPEGVAARLQPGEAALITDGSLPVRVQLPQWWKDRFLTRRAETPRDGLPARPPLDLPPYQPPSEIVVNMPAAGTAPQTDAWRNRARPAPDRDDTVLRDPDPTSPGNVSPIHPRRGQ